ncbi:MAG: hypothetical protein IIW16_02680, partial [Clostridia bacterium]|nr:hypothetical protein [Clostridia bacterium]
GLLPLDEKKIKKVISVDITNSDSKIKNKFDAYLEEKGVEIIKYGHFTDNGFVREATLPQADLIILNFFYGSQWCTNDIAPNGAYVRCLYEYIFKTNMPVLMLCNGSPYITYTFPYAKTVINTFAPTGCDPETLYEIVFGKREAKGIAPVKLP